MFRANQINSPLSNALGVLNINEITLRDNSGAAIRTVTAKEHAEALFTYLNLGGYLADEILEKAVAYLACQKPFACDTDKILANLKDSCHAARRNNHFDTDIFLAHFANLDDLAIDDIIDLIVFLQQTAFDRQYGVERDRLQAKPWMEANLASCQALFSSLSVTSAMPPRHKQYHLIGIMGASSPRVKTRLGYFLSLQLDCDTVLALSGNRELSKGLDDESIMEQTAAAIGKSVHYVRKKVGVDERDFLDGITETMMVNHLIQTTCPDKKINVVDSAIESGHWRATTSQGAADIAKSFVQQIAASNIKPASDGHYHILIIAEQPYPVRMAMQVQREFNKEMKRVLPESSASIIVEGSGPGISTDDLNNIPYLTRINSELGALMAERFNDARQLLLQQKPDMTLRDAKIILFSSRDQTYRQINSAPRFTT